MHRCHPNWECVCSAGWTRTVWGDQRGPSDELSGLRRWIYWHWERQLGGESSPRLRLLHTQLSAIHWRGPHADAYVARQRLQPGTSGPWPSFSSNQVNLCFHIIFISLHICMNTVLCKKAKRGVRWDTIWNPSVHPTQAVSQKVDFS